MGLALMNVSVLQFSSIRLRFSAWQVAQYGTVAIITKAKAQDGCTALAQGGISAVLDKLDTVDQHVQDTMQAGEFVNEKA